MESIESEKELITEGHKLYPITEYNEFLKEIPEKVFTQMKKSVFQIKTVVDSQYNFASGFLVRFPIGKTIMNCLVTNNHVIRRKVIEEGIIEISLDNYEGNEKKLSLDRKERKMLTFPELIEDVTLIQIIETDFDDENFRKEDLEFLEIEGYDYNNFTVQKGNELQNKGKEIWLIQYPQIENEKGEQLCKSTITLRCLNDDEAKKYIKYSNGLKFAKMFSKGEIDEVLPDNERYTRPYYFSHNASTLNESSGSPIFVNNSSKVIGVHRGGYQSTKTDSNDKPNVINYGTFLTDIIRKVEKGKGLISYEVRFNI